MDSCPCQNSKTPSKAINKNKAQILKIPVRSPDLNLIKNVIHLGRCEKKICFRSSGLEKKLNRAAVKLLFLLKITISLFLKIALFICIL